MEGEAEFSSQMESLRKQFSEYQEARDTLIKKSRDIVSLSKKVIYSLHRKDADSAGISLEKLRKSARDFSSEAESAGMRAENYGFASNALQEYVEAEALAQFYERRKIIQKPDFIDRTAYLSGLCDLSGELMRMAINNALSDRSLFNDCKEAVSAIFSELMLFDLPNSELRRKFDSLKYAVKRLEETALELGMRNG